MSHLTILPTVLRDIELLVSSLEALGFQPRSGGVLEGFGGEAQGVDVQVSTGDVSLGWCRQGDGSLALVGDLQRMSRSTRVQDLLSRITRRYAAMLALREAGRDVPEAKVCVSF